MVALRVKREGSMMLTNGSTQTTTTTNDKLRKNQQTNLRHQKVYIVGSDFTYTDVQFTLIKLFSTFKSFVL